VPDVPLLLFFEAFLTTFFFVFFADSLFTICANNPSLLCKDESGPQTHGDL
jgi:hypothetical protein